MTRSQAAVLVLSMSELPTITVTLLVDHDRYYVSAIIDGNEHELGRYATANEAGARMNEFVIGHGYQWAPDSAGRIDEAQRRDAVCLVLDAVPGFKALRRCQCDECE
jgi:hypothetical protein